MADWYFDQPRNLLIYPHADRLARAIPDAPQINGHLAIPRTLANSQTLRWLGYPVVQVMDDYDWPIAPPHHPLPHQKVMANFQVLHPKMFNLSDMGTMKTLSTLWAADWLMRQGHVQRALIIAPLSTLQRVWGDALFRNFLHRRTYRILHGSAAVRRRELDRPADFYIINFDGVGVGARIRRQVELEGFAADLDARDDLSLVIIDEASAYRDSRTRRGRIARLLFSQRPYLWLLSGTPTPNAPTDAYGLAKLVNNAHGKSFTTFQYETMVKVSQFKWAPQADGYEKARRLLTPSIRYDLRDVWDGPEMVTQQREAELTPQQKKLMADLKRDLVVQVKSGEPITAVNEAAARTKFMQISLGAIYDSTHVAHAVDASPRLSLLDEIIEQASGKILVFVGLTSVLNLINSHFKQARRHTWELINGDVPAKRRDTIFSDFQQREDPRIILADPGTMAHGLDLFAARTIIWYGPTDRAETYAQANRRAHRPGQKYPVNVVQIVSNPLEREIFRRLESNLTLQGTLLEMVRKNEL